MVLFNVSVQVHGVKGMWELCPVFVLFHKSRIITKSTVYLKRGRYLLSASSSWEGTRGRDGMLTPVLGCGQAVGWSRLEDKTNELGIQRSQIS